MKETDVTHGAVPQLADRYVVVFSHYDGRRSFTVFQDKEAFRGWWEQRGGRERAAQVGDTLLAEGVTDKVKLALLAAAAKPHRVDT